MSNSPANRNGTIKTPLLHESLMHERKNHDPMRFYEKVEVLGEGSMGSVVKVKKRLDVIGGSARSSFFLRQQHDFFQKLLHCWRCCTSEEVERKSSNNIIEDIPSRSMSNSTESSENLSSRSNISAMIKFGRQSESFYALKSIHLSKARSSTLRQELKNEVEILKTLDHPNIVRLVETFEYRNSLYLVMQLCPGGDLYTRDPYSEYEAARIMQSILNAVSYMHQQGISHRDLKYENIMFTSLSPNSDVKIIDFGLSKKYGKGGNMVMHDAVGTIYSMSPEVLTGTYTKQADVWSCGVLTFMMLSSTMPFYGKNRKQVMKRILRGKWSFKGPKWYLVSHEAKRFVSKLLQFSPDARPTAQEATRDSWLSDILRNGNRRVSISSIPETMDSVQASIENFSSYSTLKRLALMVIAHRSTNEEVGFLRRMFKKYDDNMGFFTLEGFKKALKDYHYSDDELEKIFIGMDIDSTGDVHYFEFLAASIEAHGFINEERLADAFDRLDLDNSGTITIQDLREFLGDEVPDSYLDKIIEEADLNQDRKIDYNDFLQMWDLQGDTDRERKLKEVSRRRLFQVSSQKEGAIQSLDDADSSDMESGVSNEALEEDDYGNLAFQRRKDLALSRRSSISWLPSSLSSLPKGPPLAKAISC